MLEVTANRADLAAHFGALGFTKGAEIGVERGKFSQVLVKSIPSLETLYLIDAWAAYEGYREHVSQERVDGFMTHVQETFKANRAVKVIKGWSTEVAKTIEDGSLDFVYLDANHEYAHVLADITAWAPKVRPGGILSGHDYCPRPSLNYGVIQAVDEFAQSHNLIPLILRGDRSPSWLWTSPF